MHDLKNSASGLQIGVCCMKSSYCLYVQREQFREIYARFTDRKKAEAFMALLRQWDEMGGSDE